MSSLSEINNFLQVISSPVVHLTNHLHTRKPLLMLSCKRGQYFAIALNMLAIIKLHLCDLYAQLNSLMLDPAYIMVTLWHSWSPTNGELWSGGGGDILTSGIELSVVDMPVWWFDLWPWQCIEMASSFSTDQRKTNRETKDHQLGDGIYGGWVSMLNLMLQMFHF